MGPAWIHTYGTNGDASYSIKDDGLAPGPKVYARVRLHPSGGTSGQNCGWILFLTKGVDLTSYRTLAFHVRGRRGGEKVGVKAKDAHGIEVAVPLDKYLPPNGLTTGWQQIEIEFSDFGPARVGGVQFAFFDNFSLFTDGQMAGSRLQEFDVGAFQLLAKEDTPAR